MFTALLIAILIVTGAATVVGGGLVLAAARRRELTAGDEPKLLSDGSGETGERGLSDLKVGDIVQHGGLDYLVEGVIHFDESGHRWRGARLTDGEEERWLVVGLERLGPQVRRLLRLDDSIELAGFPPETIVAGGTRYNLDKRGTATTRNTGDVGRIPGYQAQSKESVNRCRWWNYDGAGSDTLIVEQWSGEFRVLRGKTMSESELDFLPGS